MARVAVLEGDAQLREQLGSLLKLGGFESALFATPGRFFDGLSKGAPELLVVDMTLPGMSGKDVIRVVRGNPATRRMLIVAFSEKGTKTSEVVAGLELGADEYLLKPLDADLLVARIGALLRRAPDTSTPENVLRAGELMVWPDQRVVKLKDREIALTHLEFDLLVHLLRQVNRVLTRGLLLEAVWSGSPSMATRTVDKHVESLRRKLHPFGKHIRTVIRVGYVLNFP